MMAFELKQTVTVKDLIKFRTYDNESVDKDMESRNGKTNIQYTTNSRWSSRVI